LATKSLTKLVAHHCQFNSSSIKSCSEQLVPSVAVELAQNNAVRAVLPRR